MKKRSIFHYLWSFNSVVITLFVLLGIGFLLFSVFGGLFGGREHPVITNLAPDPDGNEKWVLGSIQDIEGSSWVLMPLISERKALSAPDPGMRKALHSYSGGYSTPSRNVLFVNQETRDMHWLFPKNAQLVTSIEMVSRVPRYERGRVADAILYHVVTSDTNADGKLSTEDATDIAASKTDGTACTTIATTVDRVFGVRASRAGTFILLYQSHGRGYVSGVRLADMAVIDTREMPRSEETP